MEKQMLIKTLSKYTMDVFANLTSRNEMETFLRSLGLKVLSGQKRLIVMDGSATVLKIAYDRNGLNDNMNEVITSNRLVELTQLGQITQDELALFGTCRIVGESPFIIEQDAGVNFNEDEDFIQWYKDNQRISGTPDYNSDALWFPVYIAENATSKSDYSTQNSIISTHIAGSDLTVTKEPRNETLFTSNNGEKHLMLIDMGSCYPLLTDSNGEYIRPKCPICGSDLIYVPYNLPSTISAKNSQDIVGRYGCTNEHCDEYYKKLSGAPRIDFEDSRVFTLYQAQHQTEIRFAQATQCYFYIPNTRVSSKQELLNAFVNEFPMNLYGEVTNEMLNAMWHNYQSYACGNFINLFNEILDVPVVQNGYVLDYDQYQQNCINVINDICASYSMANPMDNIGYKTIGLLYLPQLLENSNSDAMYNLLMMDANSFITTLVNEFGLSQQSANNLYIDVMSE